MRFTGFEGEWKKVRFFEIGDFFKGAGISKDQLSEDGNPCILYGELYTKYKNEVIKTVVSRTNIDSKGLVRSKANDIIIPSSGESAGEIATACCVNLDDVLLGGDLNIIRPHSDNGNFISYQLNGKRKLDIAKVAQGSSVIHLYNHSLKSLEMYLPTDVEEQNKIASLLSVIDARIGTQNKIIEDLELLKSICSRRLFEQRLRFKNLNGDNFENWEEKRLEDVCTILGGGTPETSKAEYWNGDIPWFTPTEIKTNFVTKSVRNITSLGLKNSSAKLLPEGTILLTTRATIGEVAIATTKCTTNQGFQSLIVKEGHNNIFIFNWLKEHKFELVKRANGSTFAEVSKSEIEKIPILIPKLAEQLKIAKFISSIDNKIEIETCLLEQLNSQKNALLNNLFI